MIVVNLGSARLEGITAVGILDGDNNRFAVLPSQIAVLKQEAERRAVLYPEPDAEETPDFSQCEMEVEAGVESGVGGKQALVFTVTNKSGIAVQMSVQSSNGNMTCHEV